jgi:hypothetical protein
MTTITIAYTKNPTDPRTTAAYRRDFSSYSCGTVAGGPFGAQICRTGVEERLTTVSGVTSNGIRYSVTTIETRDIFTIETCAGLSLFGIGSTRCRTSEGRGGWVSNGQVVVVFDGYRRSGEIDRGWRRDR